MMSPSPPRVDTTSAPSTEREDLVDKMAQYAATRHYRAEAAMEHGIALSYPYKVVVPFEELTD